MDSSGAARRKPTEQGKIQGDKWGKRWGGSPRHFCQLQLGQAGLNGDDLTGAAMAGGEQRVAVTALFLDPGLRGGKTHRVRTGSKGVRWRTRNRG